ncbi:ribose 1,5-bisphosphokinase [Vibrio mytili]|nr:ribose 1,5-bisphosphokinase [Vibrio mytili]
MISDSTLEASSDASFSSVLDGHPEPSACSDLNQCHHRISNNRMAKIYYVIGPSGAGKDTLLDAIRSAYPQDIIVAHRYITRPFGAGGENHVAVSESEYLSRQQKGLFAMSWQAHGLYYGIGVEVNTWLDKGFSVLLNGSRAELAQAQRCFGESLVPVVVNVRLEVLRARLQQRGRESAQEIERRLRRAVEYSLSGDPSYHQIDNSGDINSSVAQFSQIRCQVEGVQP